MAITKRQGIAVYAFAKKMKVSDSAVRSRIRNGSLASAVFEDGSLNEEIAIKLWNENPIERRKKVLVPYSERRAVIKQEAEEAKNEYDLKLELLSVRLETEKINLEELRKTTVDREEVKQAARAFGRAHRNAMLNFANRFGAGIAAKIDCDASLLIAELDKYMREALLEAISIPVPFHDPNDPLLKEEIE